MNPIELARYFDHTNLKLDATEADIEKLCQEAIEMGTYSVMLYPTDVKQASTLLKGMTPMVGTVVGFPSGRFSSASKQGEVVEAAKNGAAEVDVVANYPALIAGEPNLVEEELKLLTEEAHQTSMKIKVIVETCYLTDGQILDALKICENVGVDMIKTSTGFGSDGAKVEHIQLWKNNRTTNIGLKASGGIRTLNDAITLIEAGADRLGLSAGLAILNELKTGKEGTPASGY